MHVITVAFPAVGTFLKLSFVFEKIWFSTAFLSKQSKKKQSSANYHQLCEPGLFQSLNLLEVNFYVYGAKSMQ